MPVIPSLQNAMATPPATPAPIAAPANTAPQAERAASAPGQKRSETIFIPRPRPGRLNAKYMTAHPNGAFRRYVHPGYSHIHFTTRGALLSFGYVD